jgi:glucosamine-6-phosphate deaminase
LVNEAVATTEQFFPKSENVLILSPYPDDDVISMGASIVFLRQRECTVYVAYAVTGANAVRPEGDLFEKGLQLVLESPAAKAEELLSSTEELYPTIEARAKAWVRQREATHATSLLGVPPENLDFLECDY